MLVGLTTSPVGATLRDSAGLGLEGSGLRALRAQVLGFGCKELLEPISRGGCAWQSPRS